MTPVDSCYIKLIILRDQILLVIVSQPLINSNLLSYMHAERWMFVHNFSVFAIKVWRCLHHIQKSSGEIFQATFRLSSYK